jgi:hypothetical protein
MSVSISRLVEIHRPNRASSGITGHRSQSRTVTFPPFRGRRTRVSSCQRAPRCTWGAEEQIVPSGAGGCAIQRGRRAARDAIPSAEVKNEGFAFNRSGFFPGRGCAKFVGYALPTSRTTLRLRVAIRDL